MITIFYSRKSAGKSTLTAQMATMLVQTGKSVAILDADSQGTIGNWGVYRKDREGAAGIAFVSTRQGADLDLKIKQLKEIYDHVLVDLQGTDSKENRLTLAHADKVIIPFKPTQPDLDNIPYIAEMLEGLRSIKPGIEIHLVINEAPISSAKVPETEAARAYFKNFELKAANSIIHSRKAYRDSMATGLGACELKDKKAKAEVEGLWSEIYKKSLRKTSTIAKKTSKRHHA